MFSQPIDLKRAVLEEMEKLPVYNTNSAGTWHTTRCPYCGDSSDPDHGHFAVCIDLDNTDSMGFHCLRCGETGLVTDDVLNDLDILLDDDQRSSLRSLNRKSVKKNKLISSRIENIQVPLYHEGGSNRSKLQYIMDRVGADITFEEARDLKLILGLDEFMEFNHISALPYPWTEQRRMINAYYMGTLSTNNNVSNMRRVVDDERLSRYIKFKWNSKNLDANTFYNIPVSINQMYTDYLDVHVAEGFFDILSVYENVTHKNKTNHLYYAVCGFSYSTILKYLVYNGINTKIRLHIYADRDKSDWDHFKYLFGKSSIYMWFDEIYLHRNMYKNEKDYGVPGDRIIDTAKRVTVEDYIKTIEKFKGRAYH